VAESATQASGSRGGSATTVARPSQPDIYARVLAEADSLGVFRGRTGASERKVWDALLRKAPTLRGAFVHLDVSLRDLEIQTGASRNTIRGALTRLQTLGLIELSERSDGLRASSYIIHLTGLADRIARSGCGRLGTTEADSTDTHISSSPVSAYVCQLSPHVQESSPEHEVWFRKGLGDIGHRVYLALLAAEGPLSVTEVALRAGCCNRTASRKLKHLAEVGLADSGRNGRGWTVGLGSLEDAAAQVGVSGRRCAIRKSVENEREGWNAWRAFRGLELLPDRRTASERSVEPDALYGLKSPENVVSAPQRHSDDLRASAEILGANDAKKTELAVLRLPFPSCLESNPRLKTVHRGIGFRRYRTTGADRAAA
jgi:hypothetical protein